MNNNSYRLIIEDSNIDFSSFQYVIEQKNEKAEPRYYIEGPMILLDEQNQNGRIYESEEMEPAIEKYIAEYVTEHRALGEMNHPQCYTKNAEILTVDKGWVSIVDVQEGDLIYTLNKDTREIEIKPVSKKIEQDYNGKLYNIKGRSIDFTVTPNHRFPIINRKNELELHDVEYIKTPTYDKHNYIPKTGEWTGVDGDFVTLAGVDVNKLGNFKNDVSKDIQIDSKVFFAFMGLWLSEGHVSKNKNGISGKVVITQKKSENIEQIESLLSKFPDELKWDKRVNKSGTYSFTLPDIRLYNYLKPLGICYDKYIPHDLKQYSPVYLNELLHWFSVGDGRIQPNTTNVFTTSRGLIDDLHEVLIKSGGSGNITTIVTEKDYKFAGRTIKAKNKKPLYQLTYSRTKGIYLDNRFLSITEVENTFGRVYCVTVENEIFYARENGKAAWSGNSPDVDPERACDKLISLAKHGNVYVGKAMCLSTPMGKLQESLIRDNVKLGKSTRCLGQIEESSGVNYVKSPSIRAIDTVHNPSGQGKNTSCFVNGILENKEFIISYNNKNEMFYDIFENKLSKLPRHDIEKYLMEQVLNFISKVK